MRRRAILAGGATLAGAAASARAQGGRVARIGVLTARRTPSLDGFAERMRELGWVEGRNLVVERRDAEGSLERARAQAAELAGLGVEAIYVVTVTAADAARLAATTTPVVFSMLGDPVALGWVRDFARPGGNLTGIAGVDTAEISAKRVELLRDVLPGARRIGLIFSPGQPSSSEPTIRGSEEAARRLGGEIAAHGLDDVGRADAVFAALRGWGAEALAVAQSPVLASPPLQGRIVELAAAARLPAVYAESDWVELGGLMSYTPDLRDMGRRSAEFVDRILKGAKPADLPIERPTRIELRINLRAARAIGLAIPPLLLARADEVIE